MKKVISISAVCLILIMGAMCFTSCGALDLANQIINSVTYPSEYLIEYQITNEDGTVKSVSKGVDAQGNCYFKSGEEEYLYIKNNVSYEEYQEANGVFTKTGNSYTSAKVNEITNEFNTYAEKSREKFNGQYENVGEKEYQGKTCTEYTLKLKIGFFTQSYTMLVENETGICLEYYGTSTVSSYETQKTGFECVKFETKNISFQSMLAQ